jgi:hypothetical protein
MYTFVIISTLKQIKITLYTTTCFGPRSERPPSVSQCLARLRIWFYVHVSVDAVNVMAAYQPVVLACAHCGGRSETDLPPQCAHTNMTG